MIPDVTNNYTESHREATEGHRDLIIKNPNRKWDEADMDWLLRQCF